jgi:hypothetical protein
MPEVKELHRAGAPQGVKQLLGAEWEKKSEKGYPQDLKFVHRNINTFVHSGVRCRIPAGPFGWLTSGFSFDQCTPSMSLSTGPTTAYYLSVSLKARGFEKIRSSPR